jgi:ferredoxin
MPKKYHINTKVALMDFDYVFKFKITRGDNCINCGKCTKVCIYEAHKRRTDDPRKMADPNTVVCRNCFRCIQECPRGALEKSIEKDFANIGGSYWKADTLLSCGNRLKTVKCLYPVPVTEDLLPGLVLTECGRICLKSSALPGTGFPAGNISAPRSISGAS